jgi:hypothetical protein
MNRVSALTHPRGNDILLRITNGIEYPTVYVEQAAMIATTKSPLLDDAKLKRRVSVTAVEMKNANPA